MSSLFRILAALLIGVAFGRFAEAADFEGYTVIALQSSPYFSDVRAQLQALVDARGFQDVNQFCVMGWIDKSDPGILGADIYWPTQNKIIVYDTSDGKAVLSSINEIDLRTDVVKNIDWQHAPAILPWTFEEVDDLRQDCAKHGSEFAIKRRYGGWFDAKSSPLFSDVREQSQHIIDHTPAQYKDNSFCLIGQRDGPFIGAYLHWISGQKLFLWIPDQYDSVDPFAVMYSPVAVDLTHDLQDKEDSSYADRADMQREYALNILRSCRKFGYSFNLRKQS